jgi:hypothetical protein
MATTLQPDRLAGLENTLALLAESQTNPSVSGNTRLAVQSENPFQTKPLEPQRFLVVGTGANPVLWPLPRLPIPTSTITFFLLWESATRVENFRLDALLESVRQLAQPKKAKEAASTIKFNLSLNLSQLADVLRVGRPTVYSWLDEEDGVRIQAHHQQRIERVATYADLWWDKAQRPFPKELFDDALGGQLLSLLRAEVLNDPSIRKLIDALAKQLPPKRNLATVKGVGPVPRNESLTSLEEIADF